MKDYKKWFSWKLENSVSFHPRLCFTAAATPPPSSNDLLKRKSHKNATTCAVINSLSQLLSLSYQFTAVCWFRLLGQLHDDYRWRLHRAQLGHDHDDIDDGRSCSWQHNF